MLPIITLVMLMAFAGILGRERWQRKTTKYILIAAIALLQTALVLLDMYTMKVPKP